MFTRHATLPIEVFVMDLTGCRAAERGRESVRPRSDTNRWRPGPSAHVHLCSCRGGCARIYWEGHRSGMSAKMLERYSHTRQQAKRDAVNKLPRKRPK